ncbi:MAG: hypothetical protein JNM59_09075 [Hyphomonadaceae bacterium]|nr:hypothetical protein [Hyphomonadaceae bacterium]
MKTARISPALLALVLVLQTGAPQPQRLQLAALGAASEQAALNKSAASSRLSDNGW